METFGLILMGAWAVFGVAMLVIGVPVALWRNHRKSRARKARGFEVIRRG